jgi:hypothetical protein
MRQDLKDRLNWLALEAVGHFMLGWGEDDSPAILNPWKHRITDNRQLDLYPDFSELILDWEYPLAAMLNDETTELDESAIEEINSRCEELEKQF